jgi:hypothetical protein
VHQWQRRHEDEDRFVQDGSWLRDMRGELAKCAIQADRAPVGIMEFEFVADLSVLDAQTRRTLYRVRREIEPLPWRWRHMVLVRAWQATAQPVRPNRWEAP